MVPLVDAGADDDLPLNIRGFYRRMAGGVVLSFVSGIIVAYAPRESWLTAAPFVIVWLFSPLVAQWASRPQAYDPPKPPYTVNAQILRLIARRTWRFFEAFVTAEEHTLPPDNFQEEPKPTVAHRTSPTNLGLYLLSTVDAHDFGWLGQHETVERLESTLTAMIGLERFRGHFYNWYDTHDLRPLDPKYISSVDSGNLAGHLIALGNSCSEIIKRPLLDSKCMVGIEDSLMLTRESIQALANDRRTQTVESKTAGRGTRHVFVHPISPPGWVVEARDGILEKPFLHDQGTLQTPTQPGLGFTINQRALRKYGQRYFVMDRKRLVWFSLRTRGIKASKEIDRVRSDRRARSARGPV